MRHCLAVTQDTAELQSVHYILSLCGPHKTKFITLSSQCQYVSKLRSRWGHATLGWYNTTGVGYAIKTHYNCLKIDHIVLYHTANVIMIGTYWCDAIGYMATTLRKMWEI